LLIGNDLIDLRTPETQGKADHGAFVSRVFTPGEAERIRKASDPHRMLWRLWAGKEAAFKIARKRVPSAVFAHRSFEVEPAAEEDAGRVHLRGVSGLEGVVCPVRWEMTASFIHCIASEHDGHSGRMWSGVEAPDAAVLSAAGGESQAVRHLARRLAREAGLGEIDVVRDVVGTDFGPPRLCRVSSAEPVAGWDVSLSHDGRLVAAVLSGPLTR
jgi:phosphopantetheinyl transferase (holo-ACP synthase)